MIAVIGCQALLARTASAETEGQAIVAAAQTIQSQSYPQQPFSSAKYVYCFDGGTTTEATVGGYDHYSDGSYHDCNEVGHVGFDCRGLALYAVYQGTGDAVTLPTASAQAQYSEASRYGGSYISPSALQPGDLVFFGESSSDVEHVGIVVSGTGTSALIISAISEHYGIATETIHWFEGEFSWIGAVAVPGVGNAVGGTPPPAPPTLTSFTVSPQVLDGDGGTVALTASASNATAYSFSSLNPEVSGLGTVSSTSGSASDIAVLPPEATVLPQTLTFMVTASGPGGAATTIAYLSLSEVEARATGGSSQINSDYCRQVGAGPDGVSSFVACTAFNGTTFGPTVESSLLDWGYPGSDVWVPTSSGADYCRQVGAGPDNVSSVVSCTAFNGTTFESSVTSPQLDWGYPGSDVWTGPGSGGYTVVKALCTGDSGTVTLSPGLTNTAATQTLKIKGTLTGCTGEPFTAVAYSATLKTAGAVSCAVLKGASETGTGSSSYKWTPKTKPSKATGTMSMLLSETPGVALSGTVVAGPHSPLSLSGNVSEAFTGAATCATKKVKKGTFTGSAAAFN